MHTATDFPETFDGIAKPVQKWLGASVDSHGPLFAPIGGVAPMTDIAVAINNATKEIMKSGIRNNKRPDG